VDVFAYCAASFARSVGKAAGVQPLLSPPMRAEYFGHELLENHDFIYLKLHGRAGQPYWYGDGYIEALSADTVRSARLDGAVVFAASCHLPESPMLEALLDAGASAVIGGRGRNFAATDAVWGADLLGMYVRWFMKLGMRVDRALKWAKWRLRLGVQDRATKDALEFQLFRREGCIRER